MKALRTAIVVGLVAAACGEHEPASWEGGGRRLPTITIGIACSNGIPDGQECQNNFQCCSGICDFAVSITGSGGTCVQCETDSDCSEDGGGLTPICDQATLGCVSGTTSGVMCTPAGEACGVGGCCAPAVCNNNGICGISPGKDAGGD